MVRVPELDEAKHESKQEEQEVGAEFERDSAQQEDEDNVMRDAMRYSPSQWKVVIPIKNQKSWFSRGFYKVVEGFLFSRL